MYLLIVELICIIFYGILNWLSQLPSKLVETSQVS